MKVVALLALVLTASGLKAEVSVVASPVSKVVALFKGMLAQLQKEAEEDEAIYDKLACWCTTNDKEKTQAIAEAEARIADLTSQMEEFGATSAGLKTSLANLKQEGRNLQVALDQATELRTKQLAEVNAEEKDLIESISALKAAIVVLSEHHGGGAFLQVSRGHLLGVAATLQRELRRHSALLQGVLTDSARRAVDAFLQAPEGYFDAAPTFVRQSYAPQSGEIYGLLQQMQERFEADLSDTQKAELANKQAFEEVKAAKQAQIAANKDQIDAQAKELADTNAKLAQAEQDLEDTKKSLSADEQFLMMLKEKCQMTDAEWAERQKVRQSETQAVSKALAVLNSDDAHELFDRTFNTALLQERSAERSARRARASQVLSTAAGRLQRAGLAALAARVQLDAFVRVKKAIDAMIAQLAQEKQDEIAHRDYCIAELAENDRETKAKEHEDQNLDASIADLEATVAQLSKAIGGLKAEMAEMEVQLKRAGEDRERENAEFQTTAADQRATQKLLAAALATLKSFYHDKKGAALAQEDPVGPPPPPGFDAYKKNEAAGGVMDMVQQILDDAKAMEAEAIRDEEDAQTAYETFVKQTNASITAKSQDVANKAEAKANAESDLVQAKENKAAVGVELQEHATYATTLHASCDFTLKNFETRQAARDEEVNALNQAKAILSGAQ